MATSGTATFPVGTTSATVVVPVNGDTGHEPDEGFTLKLRNPLNVILAGTGPGPFWTRVTTAGEPPPGPHGRRGLRRGDGPADDVQLSEGHESG